MKNQKINVLDVPMDENDAGAETIRDYLKALLTVLWDEGEGFSGKRPFGNSSWESEVWQALVKSGHIEGEFDDQGYLKDYDGDTGYKLIAKAIQEL